MVTPVPREVAMAIAYGERHGCEEWVELLLGFEGNDPPALDRDDVTGHGAVIVAILRGEVVLSPDGPRDCYPAKNAAALRKFIERGEVDGGE